MTEESQFPFNYQQSKARWTSLLYNETRRDIETRNISEIKEESMERIYIKR